MHTIIVGLILVGVALPFKIVVEEIMAQGNEPEFPEYCMSWPLSYRILMGKQTWHFAVREIVFFCQSAAAESARARALPPQMRTIRADFLPACLPPPVSASSSHLRSPPAVPSCPVLQESKPGLLKVLFARFAHEKIKVLIELITMAIELVEEAVEKVKHGSGGGGGGDGHKGRSGAHGTSGEPRHTRTAQHLRRRSHADAEGQDAVAEAYEEGKAFAHLRFKKRVYALLLVYFAWGIMAWMVFVCALAPCETAAPAMLPRRSHRCVWRRAHF